MKGYKVLRKVGWDTHGLPVEVQVEKELGFSGKLDIEKYGKLIFITNKCSDPHKKEFANLLFKEVAELTAVFFTDKELNDKGGIGCMFKGK